MPTQMITYFVLITLWLGSSVFYAEAACEHCTKLLNYRGIWTTSIISIPGSSWFMSEAVFLNDIKDIVSDTSAIPKFNTLTTKKFIEFSIKSDLCGDNITFNMVLEHIDLDCFKICPKGYRITSWNDPTQITTSDSASLVTP